MREDMPGDTQVLPLFPPVTLFPHWKLLPSEVTQREKTKQINKPTKTKPQTKQPHPTKNKNSIKKKPKNKHKKHTKNHHQKKTTKKITK